MSKIMLVGDGKCDVLKADLESWEHEVAHISPTNVEAIEFNELVLDLVIIDLTDPIEESLEIASKIKERDIPLIFLLNSSDKLIVKQYKLTEPEGCIEKPFNPTELKYSIKLILYNHTLKKLKDSEKLFRSMVETTHEGVSISDPATLKCIYINQRFADLLGYEKEEIIGRDIAEFLFEEQQAMFAEARRKIRTGVKFDLMFKFRCKDGSVLWTLAMASPLYDSEGNHIGNLAMHSDITKRIKAEKALINANDQLESKVQERTLELTESEKKYRTLFEESPDYNLLVDSTGTIIEVNHALTNLTGSSEDELKGVNLNKLKLIHPEDLAFHLGNLFMVVGGKKVGTFESRFLDKNDNLHWGLVNMTPIMKDNEISHVLEIVTDITQQKIAENRIKSSLHEKELLLKEIHHRVKNNMQIISSMLNLQCMYVGDDEVAMIVLKNSDNRVQSMAMIHESIYDSPDLSRIDFEEYIRKIVTYLYNTYQTQRTQVKTVIDVEDVKFNIETAVPCGLIISELVSNSLKHAFPKGKKGEIHVSLHSSDDTYQLTISDNGIGLPEDSEIGKINSFGLELVNILVNQIEGKLSLDKSHGTKYTIKFKELEYKTRF
ncbi:PAS domain S-box protein [Methanobacterium formicicum]|uniref:PAS domain S-box protein n=1 Tax=Methanobacterium formicicum TaxID=2162 RepID=UPI0011859792|nr:PAS domain S-box protein [Methanobacterium formicicum]MDH2658544.1 PAS domain S-box protein [Methanobacterium formicicum]